MTQPVPELIWNQPAWIESAHAWIRQSLDAAGIALTGPIEQVHARIWSTVMKFDTSAGTHYFKACDPTAEVRLTVYLRGVQPENIPDLVAADMERGWMIMSDAGPMLRSYLKTPADLSMIEPALAQYATLQIAVSDRPERFLDLGALDRRLDRLPALAEELFADEEILRIGLENGLTPEQHRQVRATLPRYTGLCQYLLSRRVPQTLHHDDFHDGNIFVSGEPGRRRFTFSDWGESCLAHPFFSIMLCLRIVAWRAGLPDEATEAPDRMPPELNRLRDVYLALWQRYEDPAALVEIFNAAWRVGMVSRALAWRDFVKTLDEPQRADFHHFVPAWLSEYLLAMG